MYLFVCLGGPIAQVALYCGLYKVATDMYEYARREGNLRILHAKTGQGFSVIMCAVSDPQLCFSNEDQEHIAEIAATTQLPQEDLKLPCLNRREGTWRTYEGVIPCACGHQGRPTQR